ncbi:hypothetical protein [Ornithinimicrobium cryptoxanthini]|uniref:Uncharacterized protein n=1 Tax=Ornithinimicrobium cryptoxanthini TaxID=2934161 RepID=A0ABY4YH38_9MICO|nr:hypothetical protein [Ornithinimicrobium cryptoxanthini]USQ76093.1 hypothetical protein NF557_16100 [Ornithinimicrobium cryptoxanthini]
MKSRRQNGHNIDPTAWVPQVQHTIVSGHTLHKSGREHENLISVTAKTAPGTVINRLVNWLSPIKERLSLVPGEEGTFLAETLNADLTFHETGPAASEFGQVAPFRGAAEGYNTRAALMSVDFAGIKAVLNGRATLLLDSTFQQHQVTPDRP